MLNMTGWASCVAQRVAFWFRGRRAYRRVATFICYMFYKHTTLAVGDIFYAHQIGPSIPEHIFTGLACADVSSLQVCASDRLCRVAELSVRASSHVACTGTGYLRG